MPLSRVNEAMARVQRGEARYRIVLTTDEVPPVAA
jgi:D-arabinose 1-dehydrogenase-like Zn-dependent alcohol dehydrogenase